MNLKRIIREEMDDSLDWIKDIKSHRDIAQEIADETQIKNNRLFTPSGYLLTFFPPRPFPASHPSFPSLLRPFSSHCKERYGLNDDDIRDVWDEYKDIIKDKINDHSNLNESDELEWIKNVKSNQDIAQEIADETEIKNNKLYLPSSPPLPSALSYPLRFPFSLFPTLFLFLSSYRLPPAFFTKYCKEQYGLDKEESKDVWNRYKNIITDKINNLNESDEWDFVRDVKSNQDIAQEIADKSEIKNNRLYTPFTSTLLPVPSPTSVLSPFFFSLFSFSSFREYCRERYGLNDDDIRDVWDEYKDIIKDKINDHSNLNESDEWDFVRDVKSNQDIAQEIADETQIKNNRLYTPFTSTLLPSSPPFFSLLFPSSYRSSLLFSFREYCREQYGLNDEEDIWERYIEIIKDKIKNNNLDESNDLDWIDDIEPDVLTAGTFIFIDGSSDTDNRKHGFVDGEYIILEIISVDDDIVSYITNSYITSDTNIKNVRTYTDWTEYSNAVILVNNGYWRLWDRGSIKESENDFDWVINSKPTWSTYYTSLLNDIKKLPNNLEDVTLKMLEPIWMRLSTTNKLLKKGVDTQEIDTDLAIEYMIDDPWPNKKVLLPDNDAIDIIENLFIRLMRVVEGGTENSNGKKYNDAYMTSQQSIYTSTKLTLITYINGLISQLILINESEDIL